MKNIDVLSSSEIEDISYKTCMLINAGWKREYIDYTNQKFFDHKYEYLWVKPGAINDVYYVGDRIELKYFTLDQACDFEGIE